MARPTKRPRPASGSTNAQLDLGGLRLILWLLVAIQALFGAVAFLVHPLVGPTEGADPRVLLGVLAILVPMEYAAYFVLARQLKPRWQAELRERPDEPGLPPTYATQKIIGAALTVGVGMFASVIVLMSGSLPALALSLAASVVLVLQVPSEHPARAT